MTANEQAQISEVLMTIKGIQCHLSPDERQHLWDKIMEGYCEHCGDYIGDGQCYCTNDD